MMDLLVKNMQLPNIKSSRGFTLIELIVVIGMLTILFAIVLVAVNPGRQFASSRNTARSSDVNAILNAIHQNAADNNGVVNAAITTTAQTISNTGANLCPILTPNYLSALPQDPNSNNGAPITNCTTYSTGYNVVRDAQNRVTVSAPSAENGATISVTR